MKDWTLIKDTGRQRVYQLAFKVRRFKRPGERVRTIEEMFNHNIGLPDNMEITEDTKSVDKVCVSDSVNYTERLVFPVFNAVDNSTGDPCLFIWYMDIDGYISWDDSPSIKHPDEVYLRHLRMLNR